LTRCDDALVAAGSGKEIPAVRRRDYIYNVVNILPTYLQVASALFFFSFTIILSLLIGVITLGMIITMKELEELDMRNR
jgi:hypothetical protein